MIKQPHSTSKQDQDAFVAAVLHHKDGMTQRQIAEQLGTSPMQVSRLLAHAERSGYLSPAQINYPQDSDLILKATLIKLLPNICDLQIAFTDENMSESSKICAVAAAAASHWEVWGQSIAAPRTQLKVGLSGGRAVANIVDIVDLPETLSHECFSIANIPTGDWQIAADTNLAVLKRRFPGNCKPASRATQHPPKRGRQNRVPEHDQAPEGKPRVTIRPLGTLPFSPEMTEAEIVESREKVLKQERVMKLMRDFSECNLVYTGIGAIKDPNLERMIQAIGVPLKNIPSNVTGDVGYNFVHHDPEVVHADDDLGKRLISVPMTHLQAIARRREKDRVVAVAWGKLKGRPLLDAYRGRLINAMVVDTGLARELEKLIKQGYLEVPPQQ